MADWQVEYSTKAARQLTRIAAGDPKLAQQIKAAVDEVAAGQRRAASLHGKLDGSAKVRVRGWRIQVVKDAASRVLQVCAIETRGQAYSRFK